MYCSNTTSDIYYLSSRCFGKSQSWVNRIRTVLAAISFRDTVEIQTSYASYEINAGGTKSGPFRFHVAPFCVFPLAAAVPTRSSLIGS